MEETEIKSDFLKFGLGIIISTAVTFFVSISILSVILGELLGLKIPWNGVWTITGGNIGIYVATTLLYYWKAHETHDTNLKKYLQQVMFSLRPMSGFVEMLLFTFFFIYRPEIVVGYLIVKGVAGYRGESFRDEKVSQTDSKREGVNKAQASGEYSSISHIGTVLSLLIAVVAAGIFAPILSGSFAMQFFQFLR